MSTKLATPSPRTKRHKLREDSKYETVVQVHKILKSDTSSDRDNQSNLSLSRTDNSEDGESNRAFQMDDFNDNLNTINGHMPSREISVDGETQINTKILSLIETEMKRDINKHSHFTDSRPQSLSFYEDEKIPEELSGNLELLSPEERKHYRRKKDYNQLDPDERKAYNAIQDLYNNRDGEEVTTAKKSKSRKKRHVDPELGLGDSREMMIPKEKKKSKKKKRDSSSPMTNNKRKHKKKEEEQEAKTDITIALEELQDDVFENNHEDLGRGKRVKEVQDPTERLYVQKKNKFEVASRPSSRAMYKDPNVLDDFPQRKPRAPLTVAICIQKYCMKIFLPCHGLLAGLAFGQWLYLICNSHYQTVDFLHFYSNFNDVYITLFYLFITICLVSSLDRIDIAHINRRHFFDFSMTYRVIGIIVILLYAVGLILHLSVCSIENKLGLLSDSNLTILDLNITVSEIKKWNHISLWRFIFVLLPWMLVAATASDVDNMLYVHLQSMLKYLPEKCLCR
ncbi:transmembrane protein 237 [Coccinella septempunctata]|uniref:transmembrane protein 237 n=1 Tax=Coccinella septempunctata TaxID=41139 RepID=UPI001D07D20F|nr:transmembrane protein 237 [Coccinella septempunctata]